MACKLLPGTLGVPQAPDSIRSLWRSDWRDVALGPTPLAAIPEVPQNLSVCFVSQIFYLRAFG